jgi:glutamine synthetase
MFLAAWAWGLEQMAGIIESKGSDADIQEAALDAVRHAAAESRPLRFEGNAYSQAWRKEAKKRGLTIANSTPEALDLFVDPESKKLLASLGIMSEREVTAYRDIRLEQYEKTVEIEMTVLQTMLWEGVLPAISRQIALEGAARCAVAGGTEMGTWDNYLAQLSGLKIAIMDASRELDELRDGLHALGGKERAAAITEKGLPLCATIRSLCDAAEKLIARDIWPYHTYTDLLTIA